LFGQLFGDTAAAAQWNKTQYSAKQLQLFDGLLDEVTAAAVLR
jgi:hypothetical protein